MSISVEVRGVTELAGRLDKLPEASRNSLRVFMARFTLQLRDQVKANVADRFKSTGPLYQSVQSEIAEDISDISGRVFVEGVPYAAIQEYGGQTAPHEIAPAKAQALAFMAPGTLGFSGGGANDLVFAKHVNHPGSRIPERSYARLALAQMRGAFADGIRAATADAVAQAGFAMAAE